MKIIYTLLIVLTSFTVFSVESLIEGEQELSKLLLQLRASKNNSEKELNNTIFKKRFLEVLENENALTYQFTKLNTVGIIDSPDQQVRIINWNIEQDDQSQKYSCIVLHYDKKKKKYYVKELKEEPFGLQQPDDYLTDANWYGAIYYQIIPIKKGSRTMYTLLGWDYLSPMSQMKFVDVMYFSGSTVKFGSPIFKIGKTSQKRIFFEHSKKTTMYLKYEAHNKRIIFDHLTPESPNLKNFRSYYVPDMSYDALVWEKNKWVLKEDVIGNNPKEENEGKQTVYALNEKTGKVEAVEVKSKWIDPSDPNAPAGGSNHVAVTEEDASSEEQDSNGPPLTKAQKKAIKKRNKAEKKRRKKQNRPDRFFQ